MVRSAEPPDRPRTGRRPGRRASRSRPVVGSSSTTRRGAPRRPARRQPAAAARPKARRTAGPRSGRAGTARGSRPPAAAARNGRGRDRPPLARAASAETRSPAAWPRRAAAMPTQVLPEEPGGPGVRSAEAEQDGDRRRLAGAVRPEQRDDLAFPDGERGAVERPDGSEALGHVLERGDAHTRSRRRQSGLIPLFTRLRQAFCARSPTFGRPLSVRSGTVKGGTSALRSVEPTIMAAPQAAVAGGRPARAGAGCTSSALRPRRRALRSPRRRTRRRRR